MKRGIKTHEGRVALITGAAQGIGATYARALAAEGARVSVCDLDPPDAVVTIAAVPSNRAISLPSNAPSSAPTIGGPAQPRAKAMPYRFRG